MQPDIPAPRRKRSRWPIVLFVAVGLFFVFECSGIRFPMWDPKGALNRHLSDDFGMALPATATVTRGAWVAYRDPGEYFEVEMPAAEVAALVERFRSQSGKAKDVDASEPWSMGPAPAWWRSRSPTDAKRLDSMHRDDLGGYTWYYSESAGTIYVFWFRV